MGIPRSIVTMLICAFCFFLVSSSYADTEYFLVNGDRAVIEGKKMILIDKNSKRSAAPSGSYETRDGRYTIIVQGDKIRIRDKSLR
jgi:hypothetical protein